MNVNNEVAKEEDVIPEEAISPKSQQAKYKWIFALVSLVILFAAAIILWNTVPSFRAYFTDIPNQFYWFLIAGFIFAMIDGAIGMSYGVTSTAFSLSMGIPPASASTAVHLSEILSNGIAGLMHFRMGNVNKKLFWLLVIPGIIGSVTGAYLLSSLEHYSHYTKPFVSTYTLILGVIILKKAISLAQKKRPTNKKITNVRGLGLFGGFMDAVGGGGWGSIVLSTLIAGGRHARFSLGSVKASRFFVALMSSLTFITMITHLHWEAIGGLVVGSAIASPIAAKAANKISAKSIMFAVGFIVILVSLRTIGKFILSFL